MSLEYYNFKELCYYYGVKCSPPPQQVDSAVERFYRFRQEFLKQLKKTPYGSFKGFLRFQFDVLPSLIKAANSFSGNKDIKVPEDLKSALEILTETSEYITLNLMRIPLELLHYYHFKQIPCREPSIEIGCGNGLVSNYIFKGNRITIGSDPSILSMVNAKRKGNVHRLYLGIDGNAIPFSDATFNTAIAIHSIDHVHDRKQTLSEISRVLQPEGWMALSDLSEYAVSFLPLPGILQDIGYSDLGQDFIKYYFNNAGVDNIDTKSPEWYNETLNELGFEDITISYFMSEQLTRISFLFFGFQLLGAESNFSLAYKNDRGLRQQVLDFAEEVYLPLVAEDAKICSEEKKGFNLFVKARKKRNKRSKIFMGENILELLNCPLCKGLFSVKNKYIICNQCAEKYPIIDDIYFVTPSAAEADKLFVEQFGNKNLPRELSIKKKMSRYLLNSKLFSWMFYRAILFIETFPFLRKKLSKLYGGLGY